MKNEWDFHFKLKQLNFQYINIYTKKQFLSAY